MTRHAASIVLGSVLALAGCEKKDANKPATPTATKTEGAAGAFEAGKAAAAAAVLKDAKDKSVAAATTTLDELSKQFDALKLKAPTVPADAKTAFDAAITDLNTQFAGAKTQIDGLKTAAADTWQKSSADLQANLTKLGDSLKSAIDKFGK